MLIFYPRLPNGNILWTCTECGDTVEVSCSKTNAVSIYCACNGKINPQCNADWYNKGLYWTRIPIENRSKYLKEKLK